MTKKHLARAIVVVVLIGALLMQASAVLALTPNLEVGRILWNERDADGNLLAERIVDANGNEIVQSCTVEAAEDEELPAQYDLRDENCITPAKNQSGSDSCWAFSTISAMESGMIRQGYGTVEDTDYSEAHMVWFGRGRVSEDPSDPLYGEGITLENPYTGGGGWQIAASTLMRGSGVVPESAAPWIETRSPFAMMDMAPDESTRYDSVARLWSAEKISDLSITTAKKKVMEYGTVMIGYYDDTGFENTGMNKANACYYQTTKVGVMNHGVSIVGWDDNYSRTNFNSEQQPLADGAWLVKGSWGKTYGNNGFYWISYEEPSITVLTAFKAAPKDVYDNIYQYDAMYPQGTVNVASGNSMLNHFICKQNERLTHVAFYNPNTVVNATVHVYVSGKNFTFFGASPISGMTHMVSADTPAKNVPCGFTTVELAKPVELTKGQHFCIMVTFNNPNGGKVILPMEGLSRYDLADGSVLSYTGNTQESYLLVQGYWYDTNAMSGNDYNNVPIKAMTQMIGETQGATLSIHTPANITRFNVGATVDTTGLSLLYTDVYGEQTILTDGFIVKAPQLDSVGTQTVDIYYERLHCSYTIEVGRTPGDADADGVVTLKDAAAILRYLVDGFETKICAENADVNGDGLISILDVAWIRRYLAGGYGIELI